LAVQSRRNGVGCRGGGGTELIADSLEDVGAVRFDGSAEDRIGAAFNVREQERDRSRR
jgi:hypothetical protein